MKRFRLSPRLAGVIVILAFVAQQAANGGTESGYATRIPDIQHHLHIAFGTLGLALSCWSFGMIMTGLAAGPLSDRFGTRRVFLWACLLYWLPLPVIALARNAAEFGGLLLIVGWGNGLFDVAANVMAARHDSDLQQKAQARGGEQPKTRNVAWQAVFSLASVAAAAAGSLARADGVSVFAQFAVIASAGLALTIPFVRRLPDVRQHEPGLRLSEAARWRLRRIAAASFFASYPLGAVYGWATNYLAHLGATPLVAGLGLEGFALLQGLTQGAVFVVSHRAPRWIVVLVGGVLALVGGAAILVFGDLAAGVAGFALIGAGLAATLAFLSNESESAEPTSAGRAVGRVTVASYCGLATAQLAMGWIAQLTSLRLAWASVAVCGVALAVLAPSAFRLRPAHARSVPVHERRR